ncbi:MAG: hypothetical protein AB1571_01530 [Nanoarchaeota archaeon]
MDVKQLCKNLMKNFPNIPEVKSLVAYILSNPNTKREEIMAYWEGLSHNKLDETTVDIVRNMIASFYINTFSVKILTKDLIRYGQILPRDQVLLKFLVNVKNKKIHILPAWLHHIGATIKMLGLKNEKELYENPQLASHLVGCYVLLEKNKIKELEIGATTGLSLGPKVKYDPKDIGKAYSIITKFILTSKLPYDKVIFKKKV